MQKNKNLVYKNTRENFRRKLPFLFLKNKIISSIKDFFKFESFVEVDTPILQYSPGMEVHLFAFDTVFNNIDGVGEQKLYLHTSPEFSMKKLLSFGMEKIFQFTHTFRNEVISSTHYPEFLMLEWYRSFCDYNKIMDDCEKILKLSLAATSNEYFKYNYKVCYPDNLEKITVKEAFIKYCNFDLYETIDNVYNPSPYLIAEKARQLGVSVSDSDTFDDIFSKLMFEFIENNLGVNNPTILYEYPIHQAALSKKSALNPDVAERFELYICGVEVANAFTELTDRKVQEERFIKDMNEKQKIYGNTFPIDYEFLDAVDNLPDCSGIAFGVDRLCMLAAHTNEITDMLWTEISVL